MKRRYAYNTVLKAGVFILALLSSNFVSAQEPQFSQFYAASMSLNPAFTGNTLAGRVTAIYRNQWPKIPKGFVSYAFSYDHNIQELNSGVGLMVVHDKAGSGGLRFTNIAGLYSYNIKLSRHVAIRPGMKFSWTIRDYDLSGLVFNDQIVRNGASQTIESNLGEPISYFDLGTGVILYSRKYWAGISFDHLNRPNQSLMGGMSELPVKASVHGGYNIPIDKDLRKKTITSVTVAANYKAQGKWDQLDIGAYYNRNPMVFGLWYRGIPLIKAYKPGYGNHDALIFLVGYRKDNLRIGYSHDVTISRLAGHTGGSHEISLTLEFPGSGKNTRKSKWVGRKSIIPCTKF